MSDPVLDHLEENRDSILERLVEFVKIPSVSTDPSYAGGMSEARKLLLERLEEMGLSRVQTLQAGGHPAIYAEWTGAPPEAPTLLIYGHYDVQPPDPVELWSTPPFDPQIRNQRLYGRGVSDDKGPLSIALETLAAFLKVDVRLPCHVKLLLEGEEEMGSPTLPALAESYRNLLEADAVLSADGARWRSDLTTVNVGSRGNGGFEFTVRTASKDLHSGRFGGAVRNALHVMSELVAALHARDGSVAVPGFYKGVRHLDRATRETVAEIPFDEESCYEALGTSSWGEPEYGTLERLWLRPCLDVNGLWGGYTGSGGKTVIPNQAHAKLTFRVVPDQDPAGICQAVKDFLSTGCPEGCEISFGLDRGQSAAYELPTDHPLLAAVETALEKTYRQRPLRIRIGGTLPVADIFHRQLGIDTVMFSFSTADEDFHAPNEFFRLSSLDEGLTAWTHLFRSLEKAPTRT